MNPGGQVGGEPQDHVVVVAEPAGQPQPVLRRPGAVPGARHDAHAFAASGLKELVAGHDTAADLGYTGVEGITIVPFRTPGGKLHATQAAFNTALSKIRTAIERAVAHLKTWRMLSEEGCRYRPPISKYQEMLRVITGLIFFTAYE